jgi:hypothetical protein
MIMPDALSSSSLAPSWVQVNQIMDLFGTRGTLPNATPLWGKCEDETHIPKSGNLESSETPKNLELDCRGQNTSH